MNYSFTLDTTKRPTTLATIGSTATLTRVAGIKFMNLESLIEYCRAKLKEADAGIMNSMSGLDDITEAQQKLTNLKSATIDKAAVDELKTTRGYIDALKRGLDEGSDWVEHKEGATTTKFDLKTEGGRRQAQEEIAKLEAKLPDLEAKASAFDAEVEATCKHLEAIGQNEAAKAVRAAAAGAKDPNNKDAQEKFQKVLDAQIGSIGASREMAMVRLQSLVQQRGTMLQMITNMMNSVNESAKAIAANCR